MRSLLALVSLSLNIAVSPSILETGDACTKSNGEKGICTHFTDCQTAIQEVGANGRPEICSFDGRYPVVCCQGDKVRVSSVSKSGMLLANEPNNSLHSMPLDKNPQRLRKKGDACRTSKGTTGTCTHILNCLTAIQEAAVNGRPEICSFDGTDLIVCCQTDKAMESDFHRPDTLVADTFNDSYGYIPVDKNTRGLKKVRDRCVTSNRGNGYCKHFTDCRSAIDAVAANRTNGPELCGFVKWYPIICCLLYIPFDENNKSLRKCRDFYPGGSMTNRYGYIGRAHAVSVQFPFMARLGYGESDNIQWQCGGSLISEEFVLTAAHCLNSSQYGEVRYISLGELEENSKDDNIQNFTIREIHTHSNYVSFSQYHDIALVRLDRSAVLTDFVRPACLGITRNLIEGSLRLTGMGWEITSIGGPPAKKLQYGSLRIVPNEICKKSYGTSIRLKEGIVDDWQICADGGGKPKDTCQGDSGGPLEIANYEYEFQSFPEIVGVISFGRECTSAPGVYTRVLYYMPWIESIVWPDE